MTPKAYKLSAKRIMILFVLPPPHPPKKNKKKHNTFYHNSGNKYTKELHFYRNSGNNNQIKHQVTQQGLSLNPAVMLGTYYGRNKPSKYFGKYQGIW